MQKVAAQPPSPMGTGKTQAAIQAGLGWLARHRTAEGSWSPSKAQELCAAPACCFDLKEKFTDAYDVGVTSLAVLAFLGAGYTTESPSSVVFSVKSQSFPASDIVGKALRWLVRQQHDEGWFSKDRAYMYNEALATLALVEAYRLTGSEEWKAPAQKAVNFLEAAQRPNPKGQGLWGWRYESRQGIESFYQGKERNDEFKTVLLDSDTSVTGWAIKALQSARFAGLAVDQTSLDGGLDFCKWITGEDGRVGYVDPKGAGATVTGKNDQYRYHIGTMSALGMCIRLDVDIQSSDAFLEQAIGVLMADQPTASADKLSIDYYYWYHAAQALSAYDGPYSSRKSNRYWGPWKLAVQRLLLDLQDKSSNSCSHGGWITTDRWAYSAGPIYTTALNLLTLESTLDARRTGTKPARRTPPPSQSKVEASADQGDKMAKPGVQDANAKQESAEPEVKAQFPKGSRWNVHLMDYDGRTKDTTARVTAVEGNTLQMRIEQWYSVPRQLDLQCDHGTFTLVKAEALGPKPDGSPPYGIKPLSVKGSVKGDTLTVRGPAESYLPDKTTLNGTGPVEVIFTRLLEDIFPVGSRWSGTYTDENGPKSTTASVVSVSGNVIVLEVAVAALRRQNYSMTYTSGALTLDKSENTQANPISLVPQNVRGRVEGVHLVLEGTFDRQNTAIHAHETTTMRLELTRAD